MAQGLTNYSCRRASRNCWHNHWRDAARIFFPYNFAHIDERLDFIEQGSGKGITVGNEIRFDLADRLRLLISGKLSVTSITNCEHDPGKTETKTWTQVIAPWIR